MRLSKICDARGRHTVESARQGQLYRLKFCSEYANVSFVHTGFYKSPGTAQDCKRMSKDKMGTAWKGETSRPLQPGGWDIRQRFPRLLLGSLAAYHGILPSTLFLNHLSHLPGSIERQVRAVHSRVEVVMSPNPASSGSKVLPDSAGETEQDRAPCLATDTKAT